jgi:tRNA pseudouridine55 synthase
MVGDEENRGREAFLSLPKSYRATFLFGIRTDTYDLLGLVTSVTKGRLFADEITKAVENLWGTHVLPYPPYSSKAVRGIPLWRLTRDGAIDAEDIPKRKMEVRKIQIVHIETVRGAEILSRTKGLIGKVKGDFRQEKILHRWEENLRGEEEIRFSLCEVGIECSSGTYVRSLAHVVGEELGCGACVYRLVRTKVDSSSLEE